MTQIVVDTGPLVAFLNKRDRHHAWVREVLGTVEPPLVTCESVLSEACFLVRDLPGGPDTVLELVSRGIVQVSFSLADELDDVRRLMKKYQNVPMAIADACLVRMTELERDSAVLTVDGDFRVYRRNRRQVVPTIMPS
ncbi:MAG: PIN domain-containing protein [Myxococcales bacterium]|nr:PIN domain-containing protein [Myxococcales bacterium]